MIMAELMSERLREQLAHRLGVAHLVENDYWGNVPARECGALVREAIRLAEQALAGSPAAVETRRTAQPAAQWVAPVAPAPQGAPGPFEPVASGWWQSPQQPAHWTWPQR